MHVVVAGDALDDLEVVDAGDLVLGDGERGDREEGGVLDRDGGAVGLGVASSAAASAPLAPALLITGNDAPSSSLSPLDTARLIRSLDPPGSAPTYISTVPEG